MINRERPAEEPLAADNEVNTSALDGLDKSVDMSRASAKSGCRNNLFGKKRPPSKDRKSFLPSKAGKGRKDAEQNVEERFKSPH